MSPIIALITDFGFKDPFVGTMKGVMRSVGTNADIIDICHDVAPGNILSASLMLSMSAPYYPAGSIFVAVVDPGVGTDRRAIAVDIDGKIIVCPDNGLVSWLLADAGKWRAIELDKPEYFLKEVSNTFHGRDIFAPVAAHIAMGVSIDDLGTPLRDIKTLRIPQTVVGEKSIQGEIIHIDRFGNLLTNIKRSQVEQWMPSGEYNKVRIHIGSIEMFGIVRTYGDVHTGHLAAIFSSDNLLEIAENGGNAALASGSSIGSPVLIYR
ncbi:MAG: SAM hydrolase/SAM-dependent halogenase family protein [Armatimonadota bacterium]